MRNFAFSEISVGRLGDWVKGSDASNDSGFAYKTVVGRSEW